MKGNIRINNKVEGLNVTVDKDENSYVITIDEIKDRVELGTVSPGQLINDKYIVKGVNPDGSIRVFRKYVLPDRLKFGDKNNDWRESNHRKYLNNEYYKEICEEFGKENIVDSVSDMLSLDGLNDYGTCVDKVNVMSIDEYRECRRKGLIKENSDKPHSLLTPDSTPSGVGSGHVDCVCSNGNVIWTYYDYELGLRPAFSLKSTVLVSLTND